MLKKANNPKLDAFIEGGRLIAPILKELTEFAQTHRKISDIENHATNLILKAGGEPAFKKVPGYHWSTCICTNDVIVHGIPDKGYLNEGDLVTIDIGMVYKGYVTDTARSFVIGTPTPFQKQFLDVGRKTLNKALKAAKVGNTVLDISKTIQDNIKSHGFDVTRQLTGHGLGHTMHEAPSIPCFTSPDPQLKVTLKEDMVLAIEVMYMAGNWPLKTDPDGWTMRTIDGSISAVFEDDVYLTENGPIILTQVPS